MEIYQPAWRGRYLNTLKDVDGKKIMAMNGTKALLYTPVSVKPNTVYRITLELCKESGNGLVYCNIYGNKNFDFAQVKIICHDLQWNTYIIDIATRDFPPTVPLIFRLWRDPDGTGVLLVRSIKVEMMDLKEPEYKNPIIIAKQNNLVRPKNTETHEKHRPNTAVGAARQGGPHPAPISMPTPMPAPVSVSKTQKSERNKELTLAQRFPNVVHPNPKIIPEVIGEGGIKVSVIISLYNRIDFFERSLITYAKQTMPKKEFELVIIDDQSTDDIIGLCKRYASEFGLQFQYILIDNNKGAIKPEGFTPALSNNIGFKHARGSVIIVTGPESLQAEQNLQLSWEGANNGYCVYGSIFRSNLHFIEELIKKDWKNMTFTEMEKLPGAKADASVLGGWWWYYIAIRKEHMLAINGVNEQFMKGISGEDDELAFRISHFGVPLTRDEKIVGIHQDHSAVDKKDANHSFRFMDKKRWDRLRAYSQRLTREWIKHKNPVTNQGIDWGSEKAVLKKEIF